MTRAFAAMTENADKLERRRSTTQKIVEFFEELGTAIEESKAADHVMVSRGQGFHAIQVTNYGTSTQNAYIIRDPSLERSPMIEYYDDELFWPFDRMLPVAKLPETVQGNERADQMIDAFVADLVKRMEFSPEKMRSIASKLSPETAKSIDVPKPDQPNKGF